MIPSVKAFGLSPLAVRLPNALFSFLTIPLIYFFVKKLFNNSTIALISALLLTISPSHLPMSRIALEANLLPFLILLGSTLILRYRNKNKPFSVLLAGFVFGLTFYCYHSAKLFTPLYTIILAYHLKLNKKTLTLFFVPILALLSFTVILNNQAKVSRVGDIAITNPTDNWKSVADSQYQAHQNGLPVIFSRLFNNKLSYFYSRFTHNYLSYFSPQFLVTNGAGETTYGMLPGNGILGLLPFIALLYTLYLLITNQKKDRHILVFLTISLLLSPIAAVLAKGSYSANRTSIMLPFLVILSAYGLKQAYSHLKKHKIIIFLSIGFFLFNSLYFLQRYFYQADQILADGMLYGHRQAIDYIRQHYPDKQIIYSTKLSEPQTYVMFFNQVDPAIVQHQSGDWLRYEQEGRTFVDQLGQYQLANYTFKPIDFVRDSQLPDTILIGRPREFPADIKTHTIYYPYATAKDPAITIYQNEKL